MNKHILIVLPFFTLGGAETQALQIAKGFKEDGCDVTVIAFAKKNGKLIDELEKYQIKWMLANFKLSNIHDKGLGKFSNLLKFGWFLRGLRPTFIFPFTYYPNVLCSAVWRLTGAKQCFWNQRGKERLGVGIIERIAILNQPKYLSNSKSGAVFLSERHQIKSNQVQVIPNGIQPKPSKYSVKEWQDKIGKAPGQKLYVQIANFYREKNHLYLVKAWDLFLKSHPNLNAKLLLIGYAPSDYYISLVKALVYDLKLDSIIFMDSTDDVSGLLQVTDYGILTSSSEGCPNIVLEYMQAKIPVLVSKIDATVEVLGEDYPWFCDLEDEHSLTKILSLTHEKLDQKIIENNYQIVKQGYEVSHLKNTYLRLIS